MTDSVLLAKSVLHRCTRLVVVGTVVGPILNMTVDRTGLVVTRWLERASGC